MERVKELSFISNSEVGLLYEVTFEKTYLFSPTKTYKRKVFCERPNSNYLSPFAVCFETGENIMNSHLGAIIYHDYLTNYGEDNSIQNSSNRK